MADLGQRIEAMYQHDKLWAWAIVFVLWVVTLAVLILSWPFIPDQGVRVVATCSAGAVLIFNTASIAAMLSHYADDKEFIYGLDIKGLDAPEVRKGSGEQS